MANRCDKRAPFVFSYTILRGTKVRLKARNRQNEETSYLKKLAFVKVEKSELESVES